MVRRSVHRDGRTYSTLSYSTVAEAKVELKMLKKHLDEYRPNYDAGFSHHKNWLTIRACEQYGDKLTASEAERAFDLLELGRGVATSQPGRFQSDGGLYVVLDRNHRPLIAKKDESGSRVRESGRWRRVLSDEDKCCDGIDGVFYDERDGMFNVKIADVTEKKYADDGKRNDKYVIYGLPGEPAQLFRSRDLAKAKAEEVRAYVEEKVDKLVPDDLRQYPKGVYGKASEADRGTIHRVFIETKWVPRVVVTSLTLESGAQWTTPCSHIHPDGSRCVKPVHTDRSGTFEGGFCCLHGGGTRCQSIVCAPVPGNVSFAKSKIEPGAAIDEFKQEEGLWVCDSCRRRITGGDFKMPPIEHIIVNDLLARLELQFPSVLQKASRVSHDCALGVSRRRADLLLEFPTFRLVFENDEWQHSDRAVSCEHLHLSGIMVDGGAKGTRGDDEDEILKQVENGTVCKPLVVIRFNPDPYTDEGGKLHPSMFGAQVERGLTYYEGETVEYEFRMDKLLAFVAETVAKYEACVPEKELTVHKLFFCAHSPGGCGGCSGRGFRPPHSRRGRSLKPPGS